MAQQAQATALAGYRAAMGGVTLPTTDEQLTTFHSFSREDALERFREGCASDDALLAAPEAAAAAERELCDQIAEFVACTEANPAQPHVLGEARLLQGGVFAPLWRQNVTLSQEAYSAWIASLREATLERKRDAQLYRSIMEYDHDVRELRAAVVADGRWSAAGRRLALEAFEAELGTDRALVLELLYSARVGRMEEQLKGAMDTVARVELAMGEQAARGDAAAAELAALQASHEHLQAECADRHARQLEAERHATALGARLDEERAARGAAEARGAAREQAAREEQEQLLQRFAKEQRDLQLQHSAHQQAASAAVAAQTEALDARLQQASEAHAALVEQVRAAGAAQRAADEGRWEKNARETDRLRVEVFDAAKAQSSVGNSHWESAQRRLAEHAEQLLRLQQQGDDGGGGGHGGGAGAGAGGGGAELAEHSKRLREHSAQLESLAQSQSEQHQLLLAAVEELAREGEQKQEELGQASAAARAAHGELEQAHRQAAAALQEHQEAQRAFEGTVTEERTRTREALSAARAAQLELGQTADSRWQQQGEFATVQQQQLEAAVEAFKQQFQGAVQEQLARQVSVAARLEEEQRELRAAHGSLERQQDVAHGARDEALAGLRSDLAAAGAAQVAALAASEDARERAREDAEAAAALGTAAVQQAMRAHKSEMEDAVAVIAAEQRAAAGQREADLAGLSSKLAAVDGTHSDAATALAQHLDTSLAQVARHGEAVEEQRQLKHDEMELALKKLRRDQESRWVKNARETDRMRVENFDALRAQAEEQELKWQASEQGMKWLQENVKAQTGSSYTELRELVEKRGAQQQECAARVEEQSRVLARLQDGVLEVHQVEFTAAVKGLDERQELKWAANSARVSQLEQALEAAATGAEAEREKTAAEVAQRMEDSLRSTVQEITEPLDADRIRAREAVAALRQLLVEQQDRADGFAAALAELRTAQHADQSQVTEALGIFRDQIEDGSLQSSGCSGGAASLEHANEALEKHRELAATVERFMCVAEEKWESTSIMVEDMRGALVEVEQGVPLQLERASNIAEAKWEEQTRAVDQQLRELAAGANGATPRGGDSADHGNLVLELHKMFESIRVEFLARAATLRSEDQLRWTKHCRTYDEGRLRLQNSFETKFASLRTDAAAEAHRSKLSCEKAAENLEDTKWQLRRQNQRVDARLGSFGRDILVSSQSAQTALNEVKREQDQRWASNTVAMELLQIKSTPGGADSNGDNADEASSSATVDASVLDKLRVSVQAQGKSLGDLTRRCDARYGELQAAHRAFASEQAARWTSSAGEHADAMHEQQRTRTAADATQAEERNDWTRALAKYDAEGTQLMLSVEQVRSEARSSTLELKHEVDVLRSTHDATRTCHEKALADSRAEFSSKQAAASDLAVLRKREMDALQAQIVATEGRCSEISAAVEQHTSRLAAEQESLKVTNTEQLQTLAKQQEGVIASLEQEGAQKHKEVLSAFEALIKARPDSDEECDSNVASAASQATPPDAPPSPPSPPLPEEAASIKNELQLMREQLTQVKAKQELASWHQTSSAAGMADGAVAAEAEVAKSQNYVARFGEGRLGLGFAKQPDGREMVTRVVMQAEANGVVPGDVILSVGPIDLTPGITHEHVTHLLVNSARPVDITFARGGCAPTADGAPALPVVAPVGTPVGPMPTSAASAVPAAPATAATFAPPSADARAPTVASAQIAAAPAEALLPDSQLPSEVNGFVGRNNELAQMHAALQTFDRLSVVTLLGPDGSGKSSLAGEFLHLYEDSYTFVRWIEAWDDRSLFAGIFSLAQEMGLSLEGGDAHVCGLVQAELARTPGWCLAFDGVCRASTLDNVVPVGNTVGGHVIVTSRLPRLAGNAEFIGGAAVAGSASATPIAVGALDPSDSVELVMQRAGEQDRVSAAAIAELMDHHPSALAEAADSVKADGVLKLADYLLIVKTELDAAGEELSEDDDDEEGGGAPSL